MEKTLCLLKPDAVRRGLMGEILHRLERAGLKIVAMKMLQTTNEQAGEHYKDIKKEHGEAIYTQLLSFITASPIVAFVVEGDSAIAVVRKLCGTTEPAGAPVGTIRGDYAHHSFAHAKSAGKSIANLIHASANAEDAKREITIWFTLSEITSYQRDDEREHNLSL